MYVTEIPNRNSPPAILLRESYRENGKVRTRTIANISHLRPAQIDALRTSLSGPASAPRLSLPGSFLIDRSRPHGHVAAVLGSLRKLQIPRFSIPVPAVSAISQLP
jgi:hypothetical protein